MLVCDTGCVDWSDFERYDFVCWVVGGELWVGGAFQRAKCE